jgi:hypothetical protein
VIKLKESEVIMKSFEEREFDLFAHENANNKKLAKSGLALKALEQQLDSQMKTKKIQRDLKKKYSGLKQTKEIHNKKIKNFFKLGVSAGVAAVGLVFAAPALATGALAVAAISVIGTGLENSKKEKVENKMELIKNKYKALNKATVISQIQKMKQQTSQPGVVIGMGGFRKFS